jgi:hypothetical protein
MIIVTISEQTNQIILVEELPPGSMLIIFKINDKTPEPHFLTAREIIQHYEENKIREVISKLAAVQRHLIISGVDNC